MTQLEPGMKGYWSATLALSIASFITFANIHLVQPLLPVLSKQFGTSPAETTLAVSLTVFALGLGLFLFGPLSDTWGRRTVMIWTMALAVLPNFFIPFVDSFNGLLIYRMLQGFLLAGLPSVAMAYLGEEFSPRALGTAIGLYIGGNTIGGMSGRIISGTLADLYSWKAAFYAFGVVSVVALALFWWLLPPSQQFEPRPLKIRYTVLKMKDHVTNTSMLKVYGVAFFVMFSFFGIYNYITFRLSDAPFYLSTTMLGWLFLTYLAGTFSSTASGKLADLRGARFTMIIGVLVAAAGVIIMLVSSLWVIVVGLLVFCSGFFMVHTAASTWVNQHGGDTRASATSLYLIFYYTGGSIGSSALGLLWTPMGWAGVTLGTMIALALSLLFSYQLKEEKAEELQSP